MSGHGLNKRQPLNSSAWLLSSLGQHKHQCAWQENKVSRVTYLMFVVIPRRFRIRESTCQCRRHGFGHLVGLEDPLEKEMATHSNIHAWRAAVHGVRKSLTWLSKPTHACGLCNTWMIPWLSLNTSHFLLFLRLWNFLILGTPPSSQYTT